MKVQERIEALEAWHDKYPTGADYARTLEAFHVDSYMWDGSGPLADTMRELPRIEEFCGTEGERQ